MKITRRQLKKIILNEMIDPGTLAFGAGVSMGLATLYTYLFGKEPQSEEQAAREIKQHVDDLAKSSRSSDIDRSDYYQPKTPRERYQQQHGVSHRDYFSDLPDSEKAKYGYVPGDDY